MSELRRAFTQLCPNIQDTFSFWKFPCPNEQQLDGTAWFQSPQDCPLADYCAQYREIPSSKADKRRKNLSEKLVEIYSSDIKVTLVEPSASIVVRSEHQYHQNERFRLSLRKHLYEVRKWHEEHDREEKEALTKTDWRKGAGLESIATRCTKELNTKTILGRYLGFVDLRLIYAESPLAMGLLAVPEWLKVDPDLYCITGEYGPLFGGPAFPCSVYMMQDPQTGGSKCGHACIVMALGLLSDRGARMCGPYDITHRAIELHHDGQVEFLPQCDAAKVPSSRRIHRIEEINAPRMVEILNKKGADDLHVNAARVRIHRGTLFPEASRGAKVRFDADSDLDLMDIETPDAHQVACVEAYAQRIMEAYTYARYPVVLVVRLDAWVHAGQIEAESEQEKLHKLLQNHGVVVVGVESSTRDRIREPAFVVHDPASLPYSVRSVDECLHACWKASCKYPREDAPRLDEFLEFVTIAEQRVHTHLHDAIAAFRRSESSDNPSRSNALNEFHKYILQRDILVDNLTDRRLFDTDYRFVLVEKNSLPTLVSPAPLSRVRKDETSPYQRLVDLLGEWMAPEATLLWAAAGYDGRGALSHLWLFDAEHEPHNAFQAAFAFSVEEESGRLLVAVMDSVVVPNSPRRFYLESTPHA
jgi:hypothetical protein